MVDSGHLCLIMECAPATFPGFLRFSLELFGLGSHEQSPGSGSQAFQWLWEDAFRSNTTSEAPAVEDCTKVDLSAAADDAAKKNACAEAKPTNGDSCQLGTTDATKCEKGSPPFVYNDKERGESFWRAVYKPYQIPEELDEVPGMYKKI